MVLGEVGGWYGIRGRWVGRMVLGEVGGLYGIRGGGWVVWY